MATVTLREIAAKCGVSPQTVSRVLSGNGEPYKKETVKLVERTAEQLGYRPNLLVRSIQEGRTRTIGVILHWIQYSFDVNLYFGIYDAVTAAGYLPITLHYRPGVDDLSLIHSLVDRRVDGIVIFPHMEVSDSFIQEIIEREIPVAFVDTPVMDTRYADFVGVDDESGGRKAAAHLLGLGHRHLGVFYRDSFTMSKRRKGFEDEVARHKGASCVAKTSVDGDSQSVIEAFAGMLRDDPRITGVFLGADFWAPVLYRHASEMGLRIPDDLSVVGFADLDFAEQMVPSLTTLQQDAYGIGRQAVSMVLERVEGRIAGGPPRDLQFETKLIVRESTAAPPRR